MPRWSAVLVTVAVAWLVLAAGLVGLLPGPLLAIAFLFVASRFFRRFD